MSNECNTCHEPISWNKAQREKLGIRGPLNEDGQTAHYCYARVKDKEITQTQTQTHTQTKTPQQNDNVVTTTATTDSLSLTQDETRMLKDFVMTHTWPVHFSDEEIKMLREIIQVFQELKKK